MKRDVTSDRGQRAGAWGIALRRLAALGVTLAGISTAHLLAPYLAASPADFPESTPSSPHYPMLPAPLPELAEVDVRLDLAGAPQRQAPRRRVRSGVSLNAAAEPRPEDYEVLSAAELDAISQALD